MTNYYMYIENFQNVSRFQNFIVTRRNMKPCNTLSVLQEPICVKNISLHISYKTSYFQNILLKSFLNRFYTDISCLGGVFAKNTSRI